MLDGLATKLDLNHVQTPKKILPHSNTGQYFHFLKSFFYLIEKKIDHSV